MSEYNELIKNFGRIRDYMRDFLYLALRQGVIFLIKASALMITNAVELKIILEIFSDGIILIAGKGFFYPLTHRRLPKILFIVRTSQRVLQ